MPGRNRGAKQKVKRVYVPSVRPVIKELNARLKVAEAVISDLRKGATALQSPPRRRWKGKSPLQKATIIRNAILRAIAAASDGCGDNTLGAPFLLQISSKRRRG